MFKFQFLSNECKLRKRYIVTEKITMIINMYYS